MSYVACNGTVMRLMSTFVTTLPVNIPFSSSPPRTILI
ncbi:Uncharacterised protein [Segatella copri]|nr:Uncharacterised protein [Segatella copri]